MASGCFVYMSALFKIVGFERAVIWPRSYWASQETNALDTEKLVLTSLISLYARLSFSMPLLIQQTLFLIFWQPCIVLLLFNLVSFRKHRIVDCRSDFFLIKGKSQCCLLFLWRKQVLTPPQKVWAQSNSSSVSPILSVEV